MQHPFLFVRSSSLSRTVQLLYHEGMSCCNVRVVVEEVLWNFWIASVHNLQQRDTATECRLPLTSYKASTGTMPVKMITDTDRK